MSSLNVLDICERDKDILVVAFAYLFFSYVDETSFPLHSNSFLPLWQDDVEELEADAEEDTRTKVLNFLTSHPLRLAFLDSQDDALVYSAVNQTAKYLRNQVWVARTEGWDFYERYTNPFEFALSNTAFICSLFGVDGDLYPFSSIPEEHLVAALAKDLVLSRISL